MKTKILNYSLITLAVISLIACRQKKDGNMPDIMFNSLVLLDAYYWYGTKSLPLEMFSENGELYVHYIKNGKPLEKIKLSYSHSEEKDYELFYYFDELIDGNKNGQYRISDDIKYDWGYGELLYISKKNDTVTYWHDMPIFKEDIKISTTNLSRAVKQLSKIKPSFDEEGFSTYDLCYVKNFLYLLKTYPASIDYPFSDNFEDIYTSSDGKLRFYVGYYDQGGMGHGSSYPLIMVQYKHGYDVILIKDFEDYWTDDFEINFGYQNGIKIHTIQLNNKIFYLVDFALVDGIPMRDLSNGNYLRLYTIENGELKPQKLFNTTKKLLDEISFMFNGVEMYNDDETSDFDWNLIKYDEKSKTIFIPLIEGATLTDKYLQYKWDGEYFTYIGIK